MWLFLHLAAVALLTTSTSAQRKVYSGIQSVEHLLSQLNLNPADRASVSAIFQDFHVGNSTADAVQRAQLACDVARVVFDSNLISPSSANYGDLVDNNWSMTCWLTPQCVLQPETALNVSNAVLIVAFVGAQFSIRSGGHNPNIGFSSIGREGILIDLAKLNEVSLATNRTLASIGPGNRWGKVYNTLSSHGMMAVGGRANDIGVGGLLLGGGLSYWSSIHGMASTKVVNYEIVLGNSSITNANSTFNSDLWGALKGGGANYGIVTRFDVETVENSQIWFEGLLINADQLEEFLRVAVDFAAIADNDPGLSATYNLGLGGGAVYLAYNKPIKRPEMFRPFYNLSHQVIIESTIGTWVDYHNAVSALNPFGSLRIAISTYDREWDTPTLLNDYARYVAIANDVQSRLNATMYFAPQLFSKSAVAQTSIRGRSPMALLPKNHCFLEIMITWTDTNHDDEASRALQSLGETITASAQERGTYIDFLYMNDAGSSQKVLQSYGGLEEMRTVSRIYDPYRVFQDLQRGGFLLDRE